MAAESEKHDDGEDRTRVGVGPPPRPKVVQATPPEKVGAPPPPNAPSPPSATTTPDAAPPADDSTRMIRIPSVPGRPQGPPAPVPPAPASAQAPFAPAHPPAAPMPPEGARVPPQAESTTERTTVVLGDRLRRPGRLERVQPAGKGEVIVLTSKSYLVGRLGSCDVILYSPTSSREHARLTRRDGAWYLQPLAGKVVSVDGVKTGEEVKLTHRMRLQFGADELVFVDDVAEAHEREGEASLSAPQTKMLVALLVGLALLAMAAWWVL